MTQSLRKKRKTHKRCSLIKIDIENSQCSKEEKNPPRINCPIRRTSETESPATNFAFGGGGTAMAGHYSDLMIMRLWGMLIITTSQCHGLFWRATSS